LSGCIPQRTREPYPAPGRYNNATERPDPEMIMSGVQTMPFVYPLTGEERVQVLWRGL